MKKISAKRGKPTKMFTRREAIAFIGGIFLDAVAKPIVAERAVKHFDRLSPIQPNLTLPSGRPSSDPRDWLEELFGPLYAYSASPGIDNKDFPERIHPDILEPYSSILRLWEGTGRVLTPVSAKDLPVLNLGDFILLIGGPVSNKISRTWQGYRRSPATGYVEYVGRDLPRRWRFLYDLGDSKENGPARFVDGKLHRSWPQAILDTSNETGPRRASVTGADRMLVNDWLLVSFVPNTFDYSRGASFLDASDLHGQGNKAFAELLNDPLRLDELTKRLNDRGIRPRQHFQALYQVDVKHKGTTTKFVGYHLVDVELVKEP
jgi:hypothetical protein